MAEIAAKTLGPKTRFHRRRVVHPHHGNGSWTCTIGRSLNKAGDRLRPKQWYFKMPKAKAMERAHEIAVEWEFLVTHWEKMYAPTLRLIDSPFAELPHWDPRLSRLPEPSAEECERVALQPMDVADLSEGAEEVSIYGVYSLFEIEMNNVMEEQGTQRTTLESLLKSLRSGIKFFPVGLKMKNLTKNVIRDAKMAMLKKLALRTARSRMNDLKRMLKWFYASEYGGSFTPPDGFTTSLFAVRNATKTKIQPYPHDQLKELFDEAREYEQMLTLLALNCGMYQADIGRLLNEEFNLNEGYVFWDREKQPNNPFKVVHYLWPETLRLVKKFVQPAGRRTRFQIDYRFKEPTEVDCSKLAFVDRNGNMLYRILPSGKAVDKIGKIYGRFNARRRKKDPKALAYKFGHLRKSTNQLIKLAVANDIAEDKTKLGAVQEISRQFLAQREGLLDRLYSQTLEISTAKVIYKPMNQYLKMAGDQMRAAGIFKVE